MSHPLYEVTDFQYLEGYRLAVTFNDGATQVVDLELVLYGEVYGPLRDPLLFRQVQLDPETRTLVWPNGADFDPYVLHRWPQVVDQLSARLKAAAMSLR
jgi:hypothetical protein